jgi:hypothetical protein
MQARNFPSGILTEASQIRKKGRAQQTHRNSLFRGILDPFGVFPRKFCANCVGALIDRSLRMVKPHRSLYVRFEKKRGLSRPFGK